MAHDIQHHQAQHYIISELANNAYHLGDFRKAETLYKETLKNLLSDGMEQNDNSIIHVSAKLAVLYANANDDLKAREGFRFCINHLETKLKQGADDFDTMALYSLVLCWSGEFEYRRNSAVTAVDLFNKSLDVSMNINGPYHHHTLQLLNSLAASHSILNQFESAVNCMKQAIGMAQTSTMEDVIKDLPYFYINLANIYLTQYGLPNTTSNTLLKDARDSAQEALRLAKKLGDREAMIEAEKCLATISNQI